MQLISKVAKRAFSSFLLVLSIIQTQHMANSLWDEDFKSILLNCLTETEIPHQEKKPILL